MYNIQGSINNLLQTSSVLASLSPGAKHKAEQVQAERRFNESAEAREVALDESTAAGTKLRRTMQDPNATENAKTLAEVDARAASQVSETAQQNYESAAKRFFETNPKKGAKAYRSTLKPEVLSQMEQQSAMMRTKQQAATENARQALILEQERVGATKRDREPMGFGGNA